MLSEFIACMSFVCVAVFAALTGFAAILVSFYIGFWVVYIICLLVESIID